MATTLVFTLNDGTKLQGDPSGPWTPREQVDWEEQFRASFLTVFQAAAAEARARTDAAEAGEDLDPAAMHFRVKWLLWFAWHRLRPAVPGKFDAFLDTVADYDFITVPDPAPEPADVVEAPVAADPLSLDPAVEAGSPDPTSVPAP